MHTGKGYQRRATMPTHPQPVYAVPFVAVEPLVPHVRQEPVNEEAALLEALQGLDEQQRELTREICRERHRLAVMLDRIKLQKNIDKRREEARRREEEEEGGGTAPGGGRSGSTAIIIAGESGGAGAGTGRCGKHGSNRQVKVK